MTPVDVAGDALVDFFETDPPQGTLIRIHPSPASWRPLKRRLFGRLSMLSAGPRPRIRLLGYPLCAIGREHRMLATVAEPQRPAPEACSRCSRRADCSPPSSWNDELQPFGPKSAAELWRSYHRRFCSVAGTPYRPRLDALVQRLIELRRFDRRPFPFVLEPSVCVVDRVLAELRLVTFHGPLPSEAAVAVRHTRSLLYLFVRLHRDLGWTVPAPLISALASFAPFPFPVGFRATENDLALKSYVRMEHMLAGRKRALVEAVAGAAGVELAQRAIPWQDANMLGLVSTARGVDQLKLYVRAQPTRAYPEFALSALPTADPIVLLSGGQAYAVTDLGQAAPRASKWDLSTRTELVSGPVLANLSRDWLPAPAAAGLARLVDHRDHRVDLVAVGRRAQAWTFYMELS